MYGWRARIGYIDPSSATVPAEEWRQLQIAGVAYYGARVPLGMANVAGLQAMAEHMISAARSVADAGIDVLVQNGSAGAFVHGHGYDREIISQLQKATGVPTTTSLTAAVEAMHLLKINKLAVAAPYIAEVNTRLVEFLTASGFEVLALEALEMDNNLLIGRLPPETAYRLARKVVQRCVGAEGVYLSGGGMRTFEVLTALEKDLQLPVVSTNQAAIWKALRMAGILEQVDDFGRLLANY